MSGHLVDQIAALRREVAELKRQQVRYVEAPVTAADDATSTFTVEVVGQSGEKVKLGGISSPPQFLPAEGGTARLAVAGAQPIYQPTGLFGVNEENVGTLSGLNVTGAARFGGTLLEDLLDQSAQIEAWTFNWPSPGATTNEVGLRELAFVARKGHTYLTLIGGLQADINGGTGGDQQAVPFRLRATFDGTTPVITSQLLAAGIGITRWDLYPYENPTVQILNLHHETVADRTVRMLLTVAKPPNADSVALFADSTVSQRFWVILDLGPTPGDAGQANTGGGTLVTGTTVAPASAVVDGETIFEADWLSNFRGDGSYIDLSGAHQGYEATNGNMRSFLGFPDMVGPLAGAKIRYCKVWLYYPHWWYAAGGYPVVSTHNNDSKVTTPINQHDNRIEGPLVPRNSSVWIDVPVSWGEMFRDGTAKGIALGQGFSNDQKYYGRASGPGTSNKPKIAVGWTK